MWWLECSFLTGKSPGSVREPAAGRVGRTRSVRAGARLVVALWLLAAVPGVVGQVGPGDALPPLGPYGLQGELPELRGKVVLLDVWASWCAPCKASFPALGSLHREFAAAGVVIVGISVDRNEREYLQFLDRFRPPFPVARDQEQRLAAVLQPPAMPSSYLIDRRGRVREVHVGFHGERTVGHWRAQLRALVEEAP